MSILIEDKGNETVTETFKEGRNRSNAKNYVIQFVTYDAAGDIGLPAAGACAIRGGLDANKLTKLEIIDGSPVDLTANTRLFYIPFATLNVIELTVSALTTDYTWDAIIKTVDNA